MSKPFPKIDSHGSRRDLQELLRRQAILYSTLSAPITYRNGELSPWAFYSWGITLTTEGLRLAARNLLKALETFGTTQLASYGYTGLPLLSACTTINTRIAAFHLASSIINCENHLHSIAKDLRRAHCFDDGRCVVDINRFTQALAC